MIEISLKMYSFWFELILYLVHFPPLQISTTDVIENIVINLFQHYIYCFKRCAHKHMKRSCIQQFNKLFEHNWSIILIKNPSMFLKLRIITSCHIKFDKKTKTNCYI